MTKKLLLLSVLYCGFSHAQQPITNFLGGENMLYTSFDPEGAPSQTEGGSSQIWGYSNNPNGNTVDTVETPTSTELVQFPEATHVFRSVGTIDNASTNGNIYAKIQGSTVEIVGIKIDNLTLKYNTESATVGTFPLPYNYENLDETVSGTFTYNQYTGTFSGTLFTAVDASGTLGLATFEEFLVTRLRSVQNLNLSYLNFGVVGNLSIQSSSFYTDNGTPEFPILKQVTTSLVVPLLQINENRTRVEFATEFLGVDNPDNPNSRVVLVENPVKQQLKLVSNSQISEIVIFNLQGKKMGTYTTTTVDVSEYAAGVYIAVVNSASGSKTIKFVKN